MKTDMNKTLTLLQQNPRLCQEGSEATIERWGELGYSRYCLSNGKKYGHWEAWESQYKNIDGSYKNGIEDGKWIWYNKDGCIYRVINYKEGLKLSDKILSKQEDITEQKH
jgi:antitoxin component YwqK of YwqJK toxin-antitoxin module